MRVPTVLQKYPLTISVAVQVLLLAAWQAVGGNVDAYVLRSDQLNTWTLFSGPLLHLSAEHLLLDLFAFVLIGCYYEARLGWRYSAAYMLITVSVGLTFAGLYPHLGSYSGLSSHAHGLLAVGLIAQRHQQPVLATGGLGILIGKCVLELVDPMQQFGFATRDLVAYGMPVPWTHLAGVVCGLLCGLLLCHESATSRSRPVMAQCCDA